MDPTVIYYIALVVIGIISGFVNTIAGGGTLITIPTLMLTGMKADIANATNRVSILLAAIVSVKGFDKHGHLPRERTAEIVFPTLLGSLLGAISASYTPEKIIKHILLGVMVAVAVWMIANPKTFNVPEGTIPATFKEKPKAWFFLFLTGFYGGFIQVGVGFILILVLSGYLRFDMLKTNALKVAVTLSYTIVALAVFIFRNQIEWVPGLILGSGSMIGAYLSVKFAINVDKKILNWIIFVLVILAVIATILKK